MPSKGFAGGAEAVDIILKREARADLAPCPLKAFPIAEKIAMQIVSNCTPCLILQLHDLFVDDVFAESTEAENLEMGCPFFTKTHFKKMIWMKMITIKMEMSASDSIVTRHDDFRLQTTYVASGSTGSWGSSPDVDARTWSVHPFVRTIVSDTVLYLNFFTYLSAVRMLYRGITYTDDIAKISRRNSLHKNT